MASIAQAVPNSNAGIAWFWEFLKEELVPYPGRAALVTRMVVASTLIMVASMTFRLPYGGYAAIYALVLSRTSLQATSNAVRMTAIGYSLAGAYVILGLTVALADPTLRFIWIVAGFFGGFWAISAISDYAGSTRFGYLLAVTVTLWDLHEPAALKVESTLWAVGVITLAVFITLLLEMVFASFTRSDELIDGVSERLMSVAELLTRYATGESPNPSNHARLQRQAMTGTSRLRLIVHRGGFDPDYAAALNAVVALTGRLVDLAANLPYLSDRVTDDDRQRILRVATGLREICDTFAAGSVPHMREPAFYHAAPAGLLWLDEIEQTVSLIPEALMGSGVPRVLGTAAALNIEKSKSLFNGELLAPEHLKFGLRGCLAATSCYMIFNALFWPELATSVTTCVLTALTTIGASRQKQVLRLAGSIVGGFGMGMGAQVFILPHIDSIAGFTALYVVAMAIAAWIATSSPRLSYFGVQLAVAFCLINLQEFKFQTSLAVARDRVLGVLLGLFMMWLFFDQLWSSPAGVEMRRTFVSALRLLATFARGSVSGDLQKAIEANYVLREQINATFDRVRAFADGVLFEFGPSRNGDLELRARIRRWQPQLRTLFLMRIAAAKYRLREPGFELPEAVQRRQEAYDDACARILEEMADGVENSQVATANGLEQMRQLESRLADTAGEALRELPAARAESFVRLLQGIGGLTNSLAAEVPGAP